MPEFVCMEPVRQTTLLSIFAPSDLPLPADQPVDSATQTLLTAPLRFVCLNRPTTEVVKNVVQETFSDEDDDGNDSESKSRKRNPESWRQNIRKKNKNLGLEYVKANGEVSAKKEMGPPCSCRMKCYLRIGEEACKKVFNSFWQLGDYSLQNAYIAGCVRILLPKQYKKSEDAPTPSRRYFTRNFYVNVSGIDTEVCKQAFLSLHSISNGRLDRLLKKKQERGNTGFDERGRHTNKKNKVPEEKVREVRRCIDSFRKSAGFTGKRKARNVEILPANLNIRSMYRHYREDMTLKGKDPVCEFRFRKIFHSDFRIEFARPVVGQTANGSNSNSKPPTTEAVNQPIEDKPTFTILETKDNIAVGQDSYVAFTQDIYSPYPVHQQTWLFSSQP